MENLLILVHGTRHVNRNYADSHFIVPENFNIITFVKPDETITDKTIKLLVTEFSNKSRDYFSKMNNIINEKNLEIRIREIRELEKELVINYLNDEIDKDLSLKKPLVRDEYDETQFDKFLTKMNLYQINSDHINSITSLKNQLVYQLDRIKNFFKLEIRVYTAGSQAPMMSLDIKENKDGTEIDYTGTFRGIYNFNTIDYDTINYPDFNTNPTRQVQTNTIFKLKNNNDLTNEFTDPYNIFHQLKNNNINSGNLFILSCSIYDKDGQDISKNKMKLFRQESLRRQGRANKKYKIIYHIY